MDKEKLQEIIKFLKDKMWFTVAVEYDWHVTYCISCKGKQSYSVKEGFHGHLVDCELVVLLDKLQKQLDEMTNS